jgi:ribosomal protein S27AE
MAFRCPSCGVASLREHAARLLCDRCGGIMMELEDVGRAILERAGARPDIEFLGERAGKRTCPRCSQTMMTLRVKVTIHGRPITPGPELDRCADHGVWFDGNELTEVLDKVRGKPRDDDDDGHDPGGGGIGPGWL